MTKMFFKKAPAKWVKRVALTGAAFALMSGLGGCASNMTGFEFPKFGLMSNFSQSDDSDLSQPGAMNSQSLSSAGGA